MATVATLVVWGFPTGHVGSGYFGIIIATTLLSSVARYVLHELGQDYSTDEV